jgi:hypothetical protein
MAEVRKMSLETRMDMLSDYFGDRNTITDWKLFVRKWKVENSEKIVWEWEVVKNGTKN